ncbi:M23 family metallopeptidase [Microbulbifer pacificus]|uniref:M23 family metallopeptidase n=1 Tax=Microbulbifer pacificus TaxID=407164 RepID=UPI000CF53FE0|nr:M23 family metallopeptidase [Microbulbifer pacificus]
MKLQSKILAFLIIVISLGFVIPEGRVIPVSGASSSDWNKDTFWYEPWGSSGVHKGVDIFANRGASAVSATNMAILYTGSVPKGGNIVVGLGPKWRIHYFAHLDSLSESTGFLVTAGTEIGKVGDTGNAAGKPAHMHYSIVSLIPLPWKIDGATQGWKKAFYLNPMEYLASPEA